MVGATFNTCAKVFCKHVKRLGILPDKGISLHSSISIRGYRLL